MRSGDLPLIVLTPEGWAQVQPWAHGEEARRASLANESTLMQIAGEWRNRSRDEQRQLLEAVRSLSPDRASPVLEAWRAVAGKEMRARIEQSLQRH